MTRLAAPLALLLACAAVTFAAPRQRVLLVTQEKGFYHDVAHAQNGMPSLVERTLASLGRDSNLFDLEPVSDVRILPYRLKDAKAVIFFTSGEIPFTPEGLAALETWVKQGGSLLNIHGATDTLRSNPTWHNLVGGTYAGEPWTGHDPVTFKVLDKNFPACQPFGDTFTLTTPVDLETSIDRNSVHELIAVDMERTGTKRNSHAPIAWCRDYDKGKTFYTNLGHDAATWQNPAYQAHLVGAMKWLLGAEKADAKPNPQIFNREDAVVQKLAIPAPPGPPQLPEGLALNVFAQAPQFHSPSSMCVAPDGRVFVGEDEYNTNSTDRRLGTSRVKLLVDTDGDGKADKITTFADKVCAPQGMTFIGDTLYVVNAPFLTAFRDTNGDGVADERHDLITGFGPVPEGLVHHIPSGIHPGIDGFLYITVGDKGIVKATGTDGRTVSLMGGGVVRVRTDGSELELFNAGNRNPYSPAVDPYLNVFMRDNTNDGNGWNSRLSQMQRGAEYGYPRLFVNFPDEIIPCLADYGVGGATGSVYVKEPLLPKPYGDSLYTIDWGRSWVYRHNLAPKGATFRIDQEDFLFGQFPTSIDADGRGRLFISNWGRMSWSEAPPTGSIYELQSTDWHAPAMPVMSQLDNAVLLHHLSSGSAVARREAQSEILKRNHQDQASAILKLAQSPLPLDARVAALFTYAQLERSNAFPALATLCQDSTLREFALRAMADRPTLIAYANASLFAASLNDPNPRTRTQAAIALGKSNRQDLASYLIPITADPDLMARHAAQQSLRELNTIDALLSALQTTPPRSTGVPPVSSPDQIKGILRTLRSLHDPRVIQGLATFLPTTTPQLKKESLKTLERLYTIESPWDGSWWLTMPDTHGPNYKPAPWPGTPAVGNLFTTLINDKDPDVSKSAIAAAGFSRVQESAPALASLIHTNSPLKSDAVRALIDMKSTSPEAIAAMESVITTPGSDDNTISQAITLLGTTDTPAAHAALTRVVTKLDSANRPSVLDRAAAALANRPASPDQIPALGGLLSSKNQPTRIAAASALARSTDPAAKTRLADLWKSNDDAQVESLLITLTRIPPDAAKSQLAQIKSLLKDPRVNIRHAAITAAARPADTGAVADLLAAAKSYKDRNTAALALADIDPSKSTPDQITPAAGLLADTAAALAPTADKDAYNKTLAAAQRYLADTRVPRDKAAAWTKSIIQTGVIAEYEKTDPIPVPPGTSFTTPLPPDQSPAGPFNTFNVAGKSYDWKPTLITDPAGVLAMPMPAMPANTVTYLHATITAPHAGAAVLTTGSDDGLQVYLNGKKVFTIDTGRPVKADQDRTLVHLTAGTNTLLLRLNNISGDAGVQARLRQRTTEFDPAELEQLSKEIPGDPARGRAVFESVGCVKCHATDPHDSPKGPYLGEARTRFQRPHLIESILRPSAKIAQGFTTVKVTSKSDEGTTDTLGWITKEAADEITMRDAAGQSYTLPKSKITARVELPQSMMPEGLMTTTTLEDFSSLIAYLTTLNTKP